MKLRQSRWMMVAAFIAAVTACAPAAQPTAVPKGSAPTTTGAAAAKPAATTAPAAALKVTRTTLRSNLYAVFDTIEPGKDSGAEQHQLMGAVLEGVARFKPGTGDLEPVLAERWEWAPDGTKLTLFLRKGVQFHRGFGEMTAEDVVFTFQRHKDPAFASRIAPDWRPVSAIEATDQYTVVLTFSEPSPGFLGAVLAVRGSFIISKKGAETTGAEFALKPIGTGPFYVDTFQRGVEFVLKAHEQYWRGSPPTKTVQLKVIPDAIVAWNALRAGELDLLYTRDGSIMKEAAADKQFQTLLNPSQSVRTLFINNEKAPTSDLRVRQAIAHALNVPAIVESVLDGSGKPGDSVVSPNTATYVPVKTYPYDLAKARSLLSEAGIASGTTIRMIYPTTQPYPTIAETVAGALSQIGLRVQLDGFDQASWVAQLPAGDYNLTTQGLTRTQDPDSYLFVQWHSRQFPPGSNFSRYKGADALIDAVRTEVDPTRRAAASAQAQQKIADDVAGIPIYYPFNGEVFYPYVKGVTPNTSHEMDLFPVYISE